MLAYVISLFYHGTNISALNVFWEQGKVALFLEEYALVFFLEGKSSTKFSFQRVLP